MTELTFKQKEELGLSTVRGWLEPASPYGTERLRKEGFYGPSRQAELERELENIAVLCEALESDEVPLQGLRTALGGLKEIRGTLEVCRERTLTEAEFFDLTAYCLRMKTLIGKAEAFDAFSRLSGIIFSPVDDALRVLQPEESGHVSFYVEDARSPELKAAREEKRGLELRLRTEKEGREALLSARQEAVLREEKALGRIYAEMSGALRPFLEKLRENAEAAGKLDALIAKALLAKRRGCCRPEIGGSTLLLEEAVHPQIEAALNAHGRQFTPISAELSRGVTVITGANMGGKSVALKTIVLNAALALSGCFVFAKAAKVPAFAHLELINRDLSDAERGLSSFGGEILRFNEAVSRLGEGLSFIAMDEFARGTNTEEGEAIARAAVSYLSGRNAVTLLTTHYDHAADTAVRHYQVKGLKKLAELPEGAACGSGTDRLRLIGQAMDYGLTLVPPGQPCPRDALSICRLLGLPEEILAEAERAD